MKTKATINRSRSKVRSVKRASCKNIDENPPGTPLAGTRKRDRVPTATVFPCSPDLKTNVIEKHSNRSVREFITVLSVNRFASHQMNAEFCRLNIYNLLFYAFEVHLHPRFGRVPKRAMPEAVGP